MLGCVIDKGLVEMKKGSTGLTPKRKQEAAEKAARPPVAPNFATGRRRIARAATVERYIGAPIPEELRLRLEQFLGSHPELDQERCIAALLGLGLDQAELALDAPEGLAVKKAGQMAELAERLYARALGRCRK
jgi:hypothetical protein